MVSDTTPVVFVVDDDISVRESLELLLETAGWKAEIFASAEEFLSRPRTLAPSCLVLDVSLPDLNGLDLQERIADRIDMPIIFITGRGDIPMSVKAIGDAIERSRVALGNAAETQALRNSYTSLTQRERQVMELVVAGLLNKQVGNGLGISEITVKAHRGKVMQKMKADSLAQLVAIAARLGIGPAAKL